MSWIKPLLGALRYWKIWLPVLTVVALYLLHLNAVRVAYNDGWAASEKSAIERAGKRIVEMEKTNDAFRDLPALDRCRAFMRDSGLPESACD